MSAVWTSQISRLFLRCRMLQVLSTVSAFPPRACCNYLPASIFRTYKWPPNFIPRSCTPPPQTGFHLPRALATTRRLAVLETLVPNPPNPPIPPPFTLSGKDQAQSTLLVYIPLLRSA